MITLDQLQTEKLLADLASGHASAISQLAVDYSEQALISAYCVAISLCKRQKDIETRELEHTTFFQFVDEAFVAYCDLDRDFMSFLMRHIRDGEVELSAEIGRIYERYCEHDYRFTVRD